MNPTSNFDCVWFFTITLQLVLLPPLLITPLFISVQSTIHNLLLIIRVSPTAPSLLELQPLSFLIAGPLLDISLYWARSNNQMKVVVTQAKIIRDIQYVSPEAATLNIVLSQGTYSLIQRHFSVHSSCLKLTFLSFSFLTLYRHTELFWKCKCTCSKLPSVLSMLLWIRKLKSVFSSPVPAHSHRQLQRDELKVPSDGAGRAAASVQASSPAHVDSFLCFVCSLTRDAALQPPLCWSQYLDSAACLTNPIKHLKSIELKAKIFSTSSLCVVFIL